MAKQQLFIIIIAAAIYLSANNAGQVLLNSKPHPADDDDRDDDHDYDYYYLWSDNSGDDRLLLNSTNGAIVI